MSTVESLGSTTDGCLLPPAEYLGVFAIHGQSDVDIALPMEAGRR